MRVGAEFAIGGSRPGSHYTPIRPPVPILRARKLTPGDRRDSHTAHAQGMSGGRSERWRRGATGGGFGDGVGGGGGSG